MLLVSKITKKKQLGRMNKPRNQRSVDIVSGIVYRGEKDEAEKPLDSKIVFLGKKNMEKLMGYKAFLDLWSGGEVRLTITGLNPQSSFALFASMEEMKDEEIHGE